MEHNVLTMSSAVDNVEKNKQNELWSKLIYIIIANVKTNEVKEDLMYKVCKSFLKT